MHYEVLEVKRDATQEEIRKSYQRLARMHHPDKQGSSQAFQRVQHAYEVLGDLEKRRVFDQQLEQQERVGPLQETVNIDDMEYEDGMFYQECRCGGRFSVTESELEANVHWVQCDSCSLCIFIEFEIVEG